MHDFKVVAVLDRYIGQGCARDHCKVSLDRDPQRVQPELAQHLGNADSAGNAAVFAVDANSKCAIDGH